MTQGTALPGSDLELRYTYDYADRRIRKSLDADGHAGAGAESVSVAAYAGDVRTLEIARTATVPGGFLGQVVQRNFYGNGVDEILAVDRITWSGATPTTSTFWTLTDHQDSVRDIVSGNAGSLGQVVEHRQYDSFGRIVRRTTGPQAGAPATPGVGIDFGYAGRPLEARTGLSDNRARWYEPATGKFINEDPSGFKGGDANLFRYVGNDPLDQVDPSGLAAKWTSYAGKSNVPAAGWAGLGQQGSTTLTGATGSQVKASTATPTISLAASNTASANPSKPLPFASLVTTGRAAPQSPSRAIESARWTANDREAKLAAAAAYNINDGGLLRATGIAYDPTGKTGEYAKSGFSASLTYSEKNKTYYLAFRGTELGWTGMPDWRANVIQGLGFRTSQYEQAIQLGREVKRKLGDVRLEVTGHSLGGSLAAAVSYSLGVRATVFNPASVSAAYRQGTPGDIRSHIIFGDVLSVGRTIANGLPDPTYPNPNLRFAPGQIIMHPGRTWSLNPLDRHSPDQFPD
jgi:RHS repeat-associated protein